MREELKLIKFDIGYYENTFHLRVISKILAKNPLKLPNLSFLTYMQVFFTGLRLLFRTADNAYSREVVGKKA